MYDVKRKNMEALAQYQRQLRAKPQLTCLFFELTNQCNLNCLHCGSKCTASNRNFLSFDSAKAVLDDVARHCDCSQIMVCVTGGEPLLNKDVVKIIAYSHKLGFSNGMTTNATLMTEFMARNLIRAGLDTISISLDGLENAHNQFRQNSSAFSRTIDGIRNLQKCGLNPEMVTVAHKGNLASLDLLYDYLRELGIQSWKIASVDPIGRARENAELLLSSEEFKKLMCFIRSRRFDPKNTMNINFGCSHFLGLENEHMVRDFYFQCEAGLKVASVMSNGDIGACLDIERRPELIQGNIYRDSFYDVWLNGFQFFRKDRSEHCEDCLQCGDRDICMGDSAHTWDFDNNRPLYCVKQLV